MPRTAEIRNPTRARKFAVDLIPATAYWRDFTPAEEKVDFQGLEVQEGRALQSARLRMGLIYAGAMEAYVDYARKLTPGRLRDVPLFLADEIGREMARLMARAYFEGASAFQAWMRTRDEIEGRPPRPADPELGLTAQGVQALIEQANRLGLDIAKGIQKRLAPVFESTWSPDGTRLKSTKDLEDEVRSVYAGSLLEASDAPPGGLGSLLELAYFPADLLELARFRGRRMKVRNREQYERWQKQRLPFSKWIKQHVDVMIAENLAPPQLTRQQAMILLQTERTRWFNHGVIDQSRADPNVKWYQYTAVRDGNTCQTCLDRDGTIRLKTDRWWAWNTPPMHHACRCGIVPVTRREKVRVTPKGELPDETDVADGFGAFDPRKVRSARVLGITPPKGRGDAIAKRKARGRE